MSSPRRTKLLTVVATLAACAALDTSIAQDRGDATSPQQLFIDRRRLPDGATTAPPGPAETPGDTQNLDEQKRLDDLAARLKAEQDDLAAREAEARKRFEELRRLEDEADAKVKESDERLRAREAEAQREVDEAKRLADEARNKLEAELRRQSAAKVSPGTAATDAQLTPEGTSTPESASAPEPSVPASPESEASPQSPPRAALNVPAIALTCPEAAIATSALSGGRLQITVQSPCRRGQDVTLQYGPATIRRTFDDKGNAEFIADMFLGADAKTNVLFADGQTRPVQLLPGDLDKVTKVAIVWNAPVNLDLHAFEYAAMRGEPGDVWSGAPRDAAEAAALVTKDGRGHGFMSSVNSGKSAGSKVEVFTFWQSRQQSRGAIAMVLDYATRGTEPQGDDCGKGRYAQIPIEILVRETSGTISRQDGLIASAPCGKPLSSEARYQTGIVPDIRIHNAH